MKEKMKKIKKQDWFFAAVFVACTALLLWRCFYSVNYNDETYSVTSIWRFFKGGAILAEDWHPSQQLTAWILYPLYWLAYHLNKSNDGMMLTFRIYYLLFQSVIVWVCYIRLRKYRGFAIMSVLLFFFSTHNNMPTLNYNTFGIGCMMLVLVLLYTEERYRRRSLLIYGILMAFVVLSQPYSLGIFVLWGMAVCSAWLFFRKKELPALLQFRNFFYMGLGAFFVLAAFLMVVFSRAGMREVLTGIHYNLSDPEHAMDWMYKISKYFERFYRYYKYQILLLAAAAVVGVIEHFREIKVLRIECMLLSTAAFAGNLIYHGWISDYVPIDFISAVMAFYGASVFFLTKRKNWKLFFAWFCPAAAYTFCVQLATDTGILAVSASAIVASACGVICAAEGLREESRTFEKYSRNTFLSVFVCLNILQSALFLYQRIHFTWWSAPVETCTVKMDRGPAKGIYTTPEDKEWYDGILREIDSLELTEKDHVLFFELAPWMYLYADVPVATYSFWTVGEENFLEEYYEVYPEKIPTVIYCADHPEAKEKSYIKHFLEKGYVLTEFESGNIALRKFTK